MRKLYSETAFESSVDELSHCQSNCPEGTRAPRLQCLLLLTAAVATRRASHQRIVNATRQFARRPCFRQSCMRDTLKRTLRQFSRAVPGHGRCSRRGGTNSAIVTGTPATVARSDPGGAAHPVYGETGASAESARGRIRTCREGDWGELQSGRQIGCVNLGKHLAASDRPVVSARRSAVPPSLLCERQFARFPTAVWARGEFLAL